MKAGKKAAQPSDGERVVYCSRDDCAFSGDTVNDGQTGRQMYVCEAEIVILDRREPMGRTCAQFAKRETEVAK